MKKHYYCKLKALSAPDTSATVSTFAPLVVIREAIFSACLSERAQALLIAALAFELPPTTMTLFG
jgi:hypothetical protein